MGAVSLRDSYLFMVESPCGDPKFLGAEPQRARVTFLCFAKEK
jgi:hypothetical protein